MRRTTGMRATCSSPLTKYSDCSKDTIPLAAGGPGNGQRGPSLHPCSTPTLPPAQSSPDAGFGLSPPPHHSLGRAEERDGKILPEKVEGPGTVSGQRKEASQGYNPRGDPESQEQVGRAAAVSMVQCLAHPLDRCRQNEPPVPSCSDCPGTLGRVIQSPQFHGHEGELREGCGLAPEGPGTL